MASTLIGLANVDQTEGKYTEAEALYQRALAIKEAKLGKDHPDVAAILNNLANVYLRQGKYAEAEPLYQRALAIKEAKLDKDHPDVAFSLIGLATVYQTQGRYADAEALYQRALAIFEAKLGKDHPDVASTLIGLANVDQTEGKYAEAEGLYQRALAILEAKLGKDHPDVASTLIGLANVDQTEGKYAEAEGLYQRALAILEAKLGKDHPDVATTLNNLAGVYRAQGKYAEGETLAQRALAIREAKLGKDHPDVATTLNNLAGFDQAQGKYAEALAFSRRTSAAVIAHAAFETSAAQQAGQSGGLIEQRASYFRFHIRNLALAASHGVEPGPALGREGFEIAQWALQSSAGAALQQMATRLASGGGALAPLVREQQDLAVVWRERDKALIEALSKPDAQQNSTLIDNIRRQVADADARLAANNARLQKEFPDYAALAVPRPLSLEETQKLLGPDEALAFFLTGDTESTVFALTRDSFDWKVIPLGANALAQKLRAFRQGLDADQLFASQPRLFDLDLANELYASLLGPVDALVKDKKQLLVVPSGALTALPFHLLVTAKPVGAPPTLDDLSAYRSAAWLIRRQAVTVLPSVASLKALRGFAGKGRAAKPMVGFGDPLFDPGAARGRGDAYGRQNRGAQPHDARLYGLLSGRRRRSRNARAGLAAIARDGRRTQGGGQGPRRADERHSSWPRRERDHREAAAARRLPRGVFRDARPRRRRHQGPRRALAGAVDPGAAERPRRRAVESERGSATQAQRRLGGALRLQHRGRRSPRRRGAVRPRPRLLLRGRPRAPGLALGRPVGGRDPAADLRLRHRQGQPDARPRRSAPPRHAELSERSLEPAQRLPGPLGTFRDRRGGVAELRTKPKRTARHVGATETATRSLREP